MQHLSCHFIFLIAGSLRASAGSLRDNPIGASTVQYLDSPVVSWSAATSGLTQPDGCAYDLDEEMDNLLQAPVLVSGQLENTSSKEACCERCWSEALCTSSLHASASARCLLMSDLNSGAMTLEVAQLAGYRSDRWVRCQPKRSSAPPLNIKIPAHVPGDLLSDLQRAGQIGDPLFEKNFLNSSLWNHYTWQYSAQFALSSPRRPGSQTFLVFDGIKMGAKIELDGIELGVARDQFLRYQFDVTKILGEDRQAPSSHTLTVTFDPTIHVDGRFTACTGGWDWAPYSHSYLDGAHTFSKGLWKSVYLATAAPATATIAHIVPQIFYRGAYPVTRLQDGAHGGFRVAVRVHLSAAAATVGVVSLTTAWGAAGEPKSIAIPAGESRVTMETEANASAIQLWWPSGLGAQPRYNLTVALACGNHHAPVSATRMVGFRYVALVTGNDTDPDFVARAAASEGTGSHGMYLRVNGVVLFSKGANVIPMEELEGRLSADAHEAMVVAARDGSFNMLRVWGGGMFMPEAFYDACDSYGLLIYHDMQFAQSGHAPKATSTQDAELRHAVRRLASHVSIVIWDGCNECQVVMGSPTGIYATFVMSVVAEEDASRAVWPSCPALGWTTGVRMLDALPNGNALTTPKRSPSIETHGPYQHGNGFPSVNGDSVLHLFTPDLPIHVTSPPTGAAHPNVFASEFGAVAMSSFESMAPTLSPQHWGLHAGQPEDTCKGGFGKDCEGVNVMAERNYPCDNMIITYFGTPPAGYLNMTGEAPFRQQLYQCLLAQGLNVKSNIETRRSKNELGILVWQFNEIWPTGGWGSIEYGTPVAGQVLGGRWKPLHYFYRRSVLADVMATCGTDGLCYVKNDRAGESFDGTVVIRALEFATGLTRVLTTQRVTLSAGAGTSSRFRVALASVRASTHLLTAECIEEDSARAVSHNEILLAPPKELQLPRAKEDVAVAPSQNTDGSIDVVLSANATALFVTLTALAHGRFTDNSFAMVGHKEATIAFIPTKGHLVHPRTLAASLHVEHLQPNLFPGSPSRA